MSAPMRHEDVLRRLSTGDLRPEADEVRRHFGECAACRERWRELRRLIEELEQADQERRAVLEALAEPLPAELARARQAAIAAGVVAERPPGPSPRASPRRWIGYAAAAAAVVCVGWLLVRDGHRPPVGPGQGTLLGSQNDRRIVDADGVLDASGIDIDYPLGPMRSLRLELEGWSPGGERVREQLTVAQTHWSPDPLLLARFAGKLVLRVQPLDEGQRPVGSAFEREFSLSR